MKHAPTDSSALPAVFDTSDYPEADRERMFVHVYSLAVMVEILLGGGVMNLA